jgi:hypothetical protein
MSCRLFRAVVNNSSFALLACVCGTKHLHVHFTATLFGVGRIINRMRAKIVRSRFWSHAGSLACLGGYILVVLIMCPTDSI